MRREREGESWREEGGEGDGVEREGGGGGERRGKEEEKG